MSPSLSADDASQIKLLSAQYFQLIEPHSLALPAQESLIKPDVQAAIYQNLFNEAVNWPVPPVSYRTRVLKTIITRIEESIANPDEDVWSLYSLRTGPFFQKSSCDDMFLSVKFLCPDTFSLPI